MILFIDIPILGTLFDALEKLANSFTVTAQVIDKRPWASTINRVDCLWQIRTSLFERQRLYHFAILVEAVA
jgi:hypothetical protein